MPGLDTVGLRIRYARKDLRKLTQPQLATAAGIKQPSLSELETGETKEISGSTLIALSKALRVRAEWLMTGELPIEADPGAALKDDERDLLEHYRAALPRWKVSIRYMAALRGDAAQDEAAGSMNVVLAKIAAQPVPDYRVEESLQSSRHGFPPGRGPHRFDSRDGVPESGQPAKGRKRFSK